MRNDQEHLKLPIEAYRNGELLTPTIGEAIDELCATNYGFLAPLNRITWQVDRHQGWNDIYEISGEKTIGLGLNTYMYHSQPSTIDDAETHRPLRHLRHLEQGQMSRQQTYRFASRVARVNRNGLRSQSQ